jgi:RNA polymerase subunit RPABC4/transcription elongation factor Spt4
VAGSSGATFRNALQREIPVRMSLIAAGSDPLFGGVRDFFHSGVWHAIVDGTLFLLSLFWAASVYWVYRDAARRLATPWLVGGPVAFAVALPFLGALLWRALRPPEFVADVRARQLEIAFFERIRAAACPGCGAHVSPEFLACPVCRTRLRDACAECERPLEPGWRLCPYCEHPVGQPEPGAVPELAAVTGDGEHGGGFAGALGARLALSLRRSEELSGSQAGGES